MREKEKAKKKKKVELHNPRIKAIRYHMLPKLLNIYQQTICSVNYEEVIEVNMNEITLDNKRKNYTQKKFTTRVMIIAVVATLLGAFLTYKLKSVRV